MSHVGIETLLEICESGDAVADFELANRYLTGRGLRKNKPKAFGLYLKSSKDDHNHLFGFVHEALGDCYFYGLGTHVDHKAAFLSYLRGAHCAYSKSEFSVGVSFLHGYGTQTDIFMAVEYLEKATKASYDEAEFELGCLLLEEGPLQDKTRGEELITRAAYQGHAAAQVSKSKLISEKAHKTSSRQLADELFCEAYAWLNLAAATNQEFSPYRDVFQDKGQAWLIRGQTISREIGRRIKSIKIFDYPKSPSELLGIYGSVRGQ